MVTYSYSCMHINSINIMQYMIAMPKVKIIEYNSYSQYITILYRYSVDWTWFS